jgi:hypothetical protein
VLFFQTSPLALRQLLTSWAPAKDAKAATAMQAAILLGLITVFPFRNQMQQRCGQVTDTPPVLPSPRRVSPIVAQRISPKSALLRLEHGFLTWASAPCGPDSN